MGMIKCRKSKPHPYGFNYGEEYKIYKKIGKNKDSRIEDNFIYFSDWRKYLSKKYNHRIGDENFYRYLNEKSLKLKLSAYFYSSYGNFIISLVSISVSALIGYIATSMAISTAKSSVLSTEITMAYKEENFEAKYQSVNLFKDIVKALSNLEGAVDTLFWMILLFVIIGILISFIWPQIAIRDVKKRQQYIEDVKDVLDLKKYDE